MNQTNFMIHRFLLTLSAITLLSAVMAEAGSSGLIVTLNNIPGRVQRDNPDLAAARLRIKEATGHMRQAGRRNNPELEIGFANNTEFRERIFEIGISQRFPVTDRLRIEKDISVTAVKAAEAEVDEIARRLIAEARGILVEVLALRQQRQLRRQQIELAEKLASFTSEAAALGEFSSIDAGQAKLEAARLRNKIRQLQAREVAAIGSLKPILGMGTSEVLNVSGSLPPATTPGGSVDPARRPDYQAAVLRAQAAARKVDLERANRYDDVELGFVAGLERSEDAPDGYDTEGIIGFRIKMALPFWDKNEGNIEAAEARATRKSLETKALAHTIRHEASAASKEMAEWSTMLQETTNELIPLAAQQASDAETAYRDGLGDLQSVLRAREQQLELASSRIEALKNFHQARVRYDAAVATH